MFRIGDDWDSPGLCCGLKNDKNGIKYGFIFMLLWKDPVCDLIFSLIVSCLKDLYRLEEGEDNKSQD